MLPLFLHRTAGLACSHGQIALACMIHRRQSHRLTGLAITPQPDSPDATVDAIRELVLATGCRGWPAAIALPEGETLHQTVPMAPGLPSAEREAELRDHLADYLPGISPALYCIDHTLIEAGTSEDQILLTAARKAIVHAAVAIAEKAGLIVRIVDIDCHANTRALSLGPLHTLSSAPPLDTRLLTTPTPTLLTALGLALRRCPTW